MFLPSSLGLVLPRALLDPVDESIWYPTAPAVAPLLWGNTGATEGTNLGHIFTVTTVGDIHSLCYYRVDDRCASSGTMALWQVSDFTDVLLQTVDFSGHSGTGWRVLPLDTPIKSNPGKAYMVSMWIPPTEGGPPFSTTVFSTTLSYFGDRGLYSTPNGFLYAVISNGQADPRGFIRRNGSFTDGPFQRPTGNYNQNNYWLDVIINARPRPQLPDPPLTLKWPIPAGWPDASNTGPAPGTVFTVRLDDVHTLADGEIIEDLDMRAGLFVGHSDVIVRNCKIRNQFPHVVVLESGTDNILIEDCILDGVGRQNINCGGVAIGATNVIIRRNNIYRIENGFAFFSTNSPVLIEDNFVHNLRAGPGSPHYDGMQLDGANSGAHIKHNTIFNEHNDTSTIMIDNFGGATDDVLIEDNYLCGAGYTCYIDARFHPPGTEQITNVRYLRNLLRPGVAGYFLFATENFPVKEGNQFLSHGGIFDAPPPGGFVEGQNVPESFFTLDSDISASVVGDTVDAETGGLTVGISFTVLRSGQITGAKFFRTENSSTTRLKLGVWRYLGSDRLGGTELLGEQEYTNQITTGWVGFDLTTPILVNENDNLLVGVFIPRGGDGKCWVLSKIGYFWPDAVDSQWERMTAFSNNAALIVNGFESCNGMYHYGPDLAPPTDITSNDTNYHVDPYFVSPWGAALLVTGAQTTLATTQTGTINAPLTRVVVGAQTTLAATSTGTLTAIPVPGTIVGIQTTRAVTQAGSIATNRRVTGAQTTLKATQTGDIVIATTRTVNGAQTTQKAAQSGSIGYATPAGFPDGTNTGYINAPGYAGTLTPASSVASNTTYNFRVFDGAAINASNVTFNGCLFESNSTGNFNVAINGGTNIVFNYCSFTPLRSIVTAPPNAAWPSAGAAKSVDGSSGYAPYMIGGAQGYQYGIRVNGGGAVTVDHCDIWGFGNAIDLHTNGPITITNCWIHDAANGDTFAYHHDGVGYLDTPSNGTVRNVLVQNCTIASLGNTNAIAFQDATPYQNIVVDHCYLTGFNATIDMCHYVGGTGLKFINNVIGTDVRWIARPIYGDVRNNFSGANTTNQWQNNTFFVRPGTSRASGSELPWTSGDHGKYVLPNHAPGNLSATLSATDWVDSFP